MGDEGEAMMDDKVKSDLADAFNAAVTLAHSLSADEVADTVDARERVFAWAARMEAEVSRLAAENQGLREKVDELEVTLDDEEAGNVETLEAWKHQKAEVERLRKAMESIQTTLRQGFGDRYMLNRIKSLVDDVIDGHGLESAVVTDNDGEPD